jgi:hypothetical protein
MPYSPSHDILKSLPQGVALLVDESIDSNPTLFLPFAASFFLGMMSILLASLFGKVSTDIGHSLDHKPSKWRQLFMTTISAFGSYLGVTMIYELSLSYIPVRNFILSNSLKFYYICMVPWLALWVFIPFTTDVSGLISLIYVTFYTFAFHFGLIRPLSFITSRVYLRENFHFILHVVLLAATSAFTVDDAVGKRRLPGAFTFSKRHHILLQVAVACLCTNFLCFSDVLLKRHDLDAMRHDSIIQSLQSIEAWLMRRSGISLHWRPIGEITEHWSRKERQVGQTTTSDRSPCGELM